VTRHTSRRTPRVHNAPRDDYCPPVEGQYKPRYKRLARRHMLAFMTAAYHEAGHAVMAWVHDVPIKWVSIRRTQDHSGITRFREFDLADVNIAAICVAGDIAERIESLREVRFNWLRQSVDADNARFFVGLTPDPLESRRAAEGKASVGLRHRWDAVEAIAQKLERHSLVYGDDVDRLCRDAGVRRPAEQRRKPFDPDHAYIDLSDGRQVTMRQWADVLALHAFNERRARRALE
jgi:hypothetical protein